VELHEKPAVVSLPEDYRHPIFVLLLMILRSRRLGPDSKEPSHVSSNGNVTALPGPRVGCRPADIAIDKFVPGSGSAYHGTLRRNDDRVRIWSRELSYRLALPLLDRCTELVKDPGQLRSGPGICLPDPGFGHGGFKFRMLMGLLVAPRTNHLGCGARSSLETAR
jgi:hypothetical protein